MIIAPTLLALAEAMPGVKLRLERGISSADANTQPRQSVRMNTSKQFMSNVGLKPVGTATISRIYSTN